MTMYSIKHLRAVCYIGCFNKTIIHFHFSSLYRIIVSVLLFCVHIRRHCVFALNSDRSENPMFLLPVCFEGCFMQRKVIAEVAFVFGSLWIMVVATVLFEALD